MKKFNLILLLLIPIAIWSCKEKEIEPERCPSIRPVYLYYMRVVDQNGNDMLDLNNPNRIDETMIKLYEEINGQKVIARGYPTGAKLIQDYGDVNVVTLINGYGNWTVESKSLTMYIQWTPDNIDTIEFPYRSADFKVNGVAVTDQIHDGIRVSTTVIQR